MTMVFAQKSRETSQSILNHGPCSVAGSCLCLLFAPLFGAAVQAPVQKALRCLTLEVLPGSHQGGVADQGVEELPVPAGPLGAAYFGLFLLLLDQLDPCEHTDTMIPPKVLHVCHQMADAIHTSPIWALE